MGLSIGAVALVAALERNQAERHAVYVDVLLGQHPGLWIGGVVDAAQAATHHLLTQQLASERAYAQDVSHVVGIPALVEHGDRHHAAHLFSRLTLHPNGRYNPAQLLGGIATIYTRITRFGLGQQSAVDADRGCEAIPVREVPRKDPALSVDGAGLDLGFPLRRCDFRLLSFVVLVVGAFARGTGGIADDLDLLLT